MKSKAPISLLDAPELDELILKVLSRNRFGLPPNKIHKELPSSYRRSAKHLAIRLDDLLVEGRVHAWKPPVGKAKKPPAPIYSLEPLVPIISSHIIQLLRPSKTLTPAEIKKQLPAHISKHLQIFLDPLVREKKVKWHPPTKGKRLGLQEPNPADFLSTEIRKLFEKGEKLGFQVEAVLQAVQAYAKPSSSKRPLALTAGETERTIFKAMTSLKPAAAQGALVYIPDLRQALRDTFPDKESFDQAILHMAKLEKVQLQSHSLPVELTEEQRAAMIDNGRGSYFMAVGIRME
jgi:hypothetical protein